MEGTVSYRERTNTFYCQECESHTPCPRRILHNPEKFVEMLELVNLDHTECAEYSDYRLAKNARMFRKETKRLMLIAPRPQIQR
jgi:hypothetical protein